MSGCASRPPTPSTEAATAWPRDILLPQEDGAGSEAAFAYAEMLSKATGAALTGVTFAVVPLTVPGGYMEVSAETWVAAREAARAEASEQYARIKPRFDRARGAELTRLDILQGDVGTEFAARARAADLVVMGWSRDDSSPFQRELFHGALFESGRPVLVIPAGFTAQHPPRRILVAWRSTREATRAMHDALPFLARAESVKLLVVDDGHVNLRITGDPSAAAVRHLVRHNVHADATLAALAGRDVAAAILDEARACKADLVVLGGYGHSPAREWLFGGVTRDILAATDVPLFVSH